MNQILVMEDKKKKNKNRSSGPADIGSILRFFVIALIIFGVLFIGHGSYAIYKDAKGKDTKNLPTLTMERVNDEVIIKAASSIKIKNLIYSWNTDEETKIPVDGTFVEENVLLLNENSTLNVKIEDEKGRTIKYEKEFIVEGVDITKPTIEIEEEGSNGTIKIVSTDDTKMSYIEYTINDQDPIRVDKSDVEDKVMNYILKLQKGENKLTVTAVDASGNYETKEKTIIVSGKTKVNMKIENGKLVVIAEDPDGIKDIAINLNGVTKSANNINQKSVKATLDIIEGTNNIRIKITNVNSLTTTGAKEFNYAK